MARIEVTDEAVEVELGELTAGDVFERGGRFFMLCEVNKPKRGDGTIRWDFYRAASGTDDDALDRFTFVDLSTGELMVDFHNWSVVPVYAKFSMASHRHGRKPSVRKCK